jgi:branched-chain amino acid transport system ATP-binding protein
MLEVRDVEFGYGAALTVQNITLEVKSGECVALLGGNGAGKSTVLKLIAGTYKPWSGAITVEGTSLIGYAAHAIARRGIRLVQQGHPVFNSMTVREHLQIANDMLQLTDGVRTHVTPSEAFDLFPRLRERASVRASSLSGGERAFVGLAQALVAGCSLLLLDEPSAGLAPTAIGELFDLLGNINRTTGVTMLVVEQNAAAAVGICQRAYVMSEGKLVLSGTPDELYANDNIVNAYLSF